MILLQRNLDPFAVVMRGVLAQGRGFGTRGLVRSEPRFCRWNTFVRNHRVALSRRVVRPAQ